MSVPDKPQEVVLTQEIRPSVTPAGIVTTLEEVTVPLALIVTRNIPTPVVEAPTATQPAPAGQLTE
jgi:hypothetical protein